MGNAISFNSPQLQGASLSDSNGQYNFQTSYAFDPKNSNDFGITATLAYFAQPGPITPIITIPAAPTAGALPLTIQCNPFPSEASTSSLLCPGLANSRINPGTVTLAFTAYEGDFLPDYSGAYAFSVTTLVTEEGGTKTVYDGTITEYNTIYETLTGTTETTVPGTCPTNPAKQTGAAASSGSAMHSKLVASTGSRRPSANSTMPRPTGSASVRLSQSVSPSANSTMLHPTGSPSLRSSQSLSHFGIVPSPKSNSTMQHHGIGTGTGTPIFPSSNSIRPRPTSFPSSLTLDSVIFSNTQLSPKSNSSVLYHPSGTGRSVSPLPDESLHPFSSPSSRALGSRPHTESTLASKTNSTIRHYGTGTGTAVSGSSSIVPSSLANDRPTSFSSGITHVFSSHGKPVFPSSNLTQVPFSNGRLSSTPSIGFSSGLGHNKPTSASATGYVPSGKTYNSVDGSKPSSAPSLGFSTGPTHNAPASASLTGSLLSGIGQITPNSSGKTSDGPSFNPLSGLKHDSSVATSLVGSLPSDTAHIYPGSGMLNYSLSDSVHTESGTGESLSKPSLGPAASAMHDFQIFTNSTKPASDIPTITNQSRPSPSSSSGLTHDSPKITGSMALPSNIHTITYSGVSSTSTSTIIGVTTITTVITTFVPCSSAIATQGSTTVYSSSLTKSLITKTITSLTTEYIVICPATEGGAQTSTTQAVPLQPPKTTVIVTTTRYTCPTSPPSCPTEAPLHKRDAGFSGPDYTLSEGDTGPTITSEETITTQTTTQVDITSIVDNRSILTIREGCSASTTGPYASSFLSGTGPGLPLSITKVPDQSGPKIEIPDE